MFNVLKILNELGVQCVKKIRPRSFVYMKIHAFLKKKKSFATYE